MPLNKEMLEYLSDNWHWSCNKLGIYVHKERIYKFLIYMYNDPRRYYHNLYHIHDSLIRVKDFVEPLSLYENNEALINLAIWFHDAVYDVGSSNNEVNSAELAYNFVDRSDYLSFKAEILYNVILSTDHKKFNEDLFNNSFDKIFKIVLDIDLAGLGSDYEQYMINAENIRKEYKQVYLHTEFMTGRIKFLKKMLSRRIYYTDFYYYKYEQQTKANLTKELEILNNSK